MRKLFLTSACLSSEGVIRCVHHDGDWVQLELLICLTWCEPYEGIITKKRVKDEASCRVTTKRRTSDGSSQLCNEVMKTASSFLVALITRVHFCQFCCGFFCAFLLPLLCHSLESRSWADAGSLLLTKAHRMHLFFHPKVTGAYDLSCDTGTTELCSATVRSVLPVCG